MWPPPDSPGPIGTLVGGNSTAGRSLPPTTVRLLLRPRVQAGADRERVGEVHALVEGDLVLGEERAVEWVALVFERAGGCLEKFRGPAHDHCPPGIDAVITENSLFSVIDVGKAIRPALRSRWQASRT